MTLLGKTVLVTGGARGIGRAIAFALARQGTQVAVLDVLTDAARETAEALAGSGTKSLALAADLTRRVEVERAVAEMIVFSKTLAREPRPPGSHLDNLSQTVDTGPAGPSNGTRH